MQRQTHDQRMKTTHLSHTVQINLLVDHIDVRTTAIAPHHVSQFLSFL